MKKNSHHAVITVIKEDGMKMPFAGSKLTFRCDTLGFDYRNTEISGNVVKEPFFFM